MSRKSQSLILVALALTILILFWTLHLKRSVSDEGAANGDQFDRAHKSAIKQIIDYEGDRTKERLAGGPNQPIVDSDSTDHPDKSPSSSPNAYGASLVSVSKSIRKGRLNEDESVGSPSVGAFDNQAWLNDSSSIDAMLQQAENANRNWTFGWIRSKHSIQTADIKRDLSRFDASLLGVSGTLIRVKVPHNRKDLEAINLLSWVAGFAALPKELKLLGDIENVVKETRYTSPFAIFVVVPTAEMEHFFRSEFEKIGIVVGHFDPSIRTFSAVIQEPQLTDLVELDFVQAVEPIATVSATHDSAVPAVGGDALRSVGSTADSYTGFTGVSVPIGILDTGLNANHIALSSFRKSICGTNFVEGEDHDLWTDKYGHGTHVTGTIAGNGYFQPKYAGIAPGIEHIRFAKVLDTTGYGSTLDVIQGMDFLAKPTSCPEEGWTEDRVTPLIVNMSLALNSRFWTGISTGARKLDSIVWTHRQLYVVSNSNRSIYSYSNYASAKNSLSVGAVHDNGDIAETSSHGPTYDGRLQPLLVGPGVDVMSTAGDGSYEGYRELSGTSMSSPSVAGVAALLMDASPEHRDEPALVRARLMASALRPEAWLDSEVAFPQNNTNGPGTMQAMYGMGLVSARTSIVNHDVPEGWTSSGATLTLETGEYGYEDIVVPVGTERLDIVMTWNEPPAETIASTVLNDLDLWIDHGADCDSEPCGEYSSQSKIDNVEWVIIQDPEPGTYRIKVSGERIYTTPPRAGVAWTMIRGPTTPQLSLEVDQTIYEVASGEEHNHSVEVTISTDGYVAAGTMLHVDCRTADDKPCESLGVDASDFSSFFRIFRGSVQREDGITTYHPFVQSMDLGEVGYDEEQRVIVQLASRSEGPLRIYFTVTAWNGKSTSTSVIFRELDSDDEPTSEAQRSLNDAYDTPTLLENGGGVLEIDTLLAASESGEPIFSESDRRPTQSLWFQWTAEQSGLASFVVSPRNKLPSWYLNRFPPGIDIFLQTGHCCGIASAQLVASSIWSAQFFAEQGKEYRIRVSGSHASMPLTLNWFVGERPPNDYFADAITLTGESGTVSGHNVGATLEPGEVYGTLASTVWYRWTAPEDGDWEFQIADAGVVHILVFSGDTIDDLRLVSGLSDQGDPVSVAALQDENYHIMVASPDAFSGGDEFDELTWARQTTTRSGWDWFRNGTRLATTVSGSVSLSHRVSLGVQPNEPEATGIQTGWLKWNAPGDGRYTWYWDTPELQLKPFSGNAIEELSATDAGANNVIARGSEFIFEATEGGAYAISIGRANDNNEAYTFTRVSTHTQLRWGETPTNNWISGAISLSGSTGNVTGSNQFATTGSSFRRHLGYSSLWYSYEAGETGWYKFWVEGANSTSVLSAFHPSESNLNPELIMASRTTRIRGEGVEVVVYIKRGSSVLLRVGSTRAHTSSNFELHWSTTDSPNWLIYRGRVADGHRDSSGQVISLLGLADLAFNSDGTLLFASTHEGISVFQRDPETGNLSLQQEIDEPDPSSFLLWDSYRDRLYAHSEDSWWTFSTSSQDSSEFVLDQTDHGIGSLLGSKSKGSPVLFMGNSGDYLYRTINNSQSVYSFNSDGTLNVVGDISVFSQDVFPSTNGNHWWQWWQWEMQLLGREVGSGLFQRISKPWRNTHRNFFTGAFSGDDDYFFTASREARVTADLTFYTIDYVTGVVEPSFSDQIDNLGISICIAAIPRTGSHAVDVLCRYGAYVVEFSPEAGEIKLSDHIANVNYRTLIPDRFGRRIPPYQFAVTRSGGTSPVEASPDGRHVYIATSNHGILTLERFGNEVTDLTDSQQHRVLRLDLLQASKNQIQFNDDIAVDGCLTASDWVVDNVSYSVVDSKWQHRTVDSSWSDIEGTEETGQLCSYASTDSKEYRTVATFMRDGESIKFASNFYGEIVYERLDDLTVESGEITLDSLSMSECTEIINLEVNDVKYTVNESKWQERDDSSSDWSDIESTITAGELCPYEPEDDGEYRLVGRFVIDDEPEYYSSNAMQEASE